MLEPGRGLKATLCLILVAMGLKVVLGYDKAVGTALVNASPEWLTSLTNQL